MLPAPPVSKTFTRPWWQVRLTHGVPGSDIIDAWATF